MTQDRRAPVARRIHLAGGKLEGFRVLIKDRSASRIVWEMPAPTMKAGHAVVRALRELDGTKGVF